MIALTTIARGDASRITEPRRSIVRSPEEWTALWAAHAGPDAAAPAVDFTSLVVAAAFAGERPTAGHAIEITAAVEGPGGARLVVEQRAPGPGMMAAQILTSPFHIVSLPRTAGEVTWVDAAPAASDLSKRPDPSRPSRLPPPASSARAATAGRPGAGTSSTGLKPTTAAALAYLAGPISGATILLAESRSEFVRFHAWQSIIGIGGLGLALIAAFVLAFTSLFVTASGVSVMVRVATGIWIVLVAAVAICLWKAWTGQRWKLPLAGTLAERRAALPPTSPRGPAAR